MGMGVIEPWHLVIILVIALVIFGPGKLGDVGGALGRGIREFKSTMNTELDETKPKEKDTNSAEGSTVKKEVTEKTT